MTNRYSPNWFWQQLGYTVEYSGKYNTRRRVTNQAGEVVYHGCDPEEACKVGQRLYLQHLKQRRAERQE